MTLADGASSGGKGVSVLGDTVTLTAAGTYAVTGSLTSGSLVIDAPDAVVNLVLDGVDITAADVAAINVVNAGQVVVLLADGSVNTLADASGTLTVTAAGDALKSDNESVTDQPDAAVGVIWIADGTLDLTAGSDGADAARQVTVTGGDLTIAAGDDGLHSDAVLRIDGGTIAITESVEGIEGAYMYLSGGDVTVAASDDGINVSGGLEALATVSGAAATVDQGMAVDPGMPADQADGMPGGPGPGMAVDQAVPADQAIPADRAVGMQGGPDSQVGTTATVDEITTLTVSAMVGSGFGGPAEGDNGTRFLEFSGGTYVLDTHSDGVDVNGSMTMTGGTLVVSGTDDTRNGALDVDDTLTVTGGTLAANGTSEMAVAPGETSTQPSLAMTFSGTVPAGTLITITDGDGTQIACFTTAKASQSFIFSSSDITSGADYTVSVGGTVTGTSVGWLVLDGTATDATTIGTVAAA